MKQPIPLGAGELSSIITAMLLEQGKTEYTLSFNDYTNLGLGDCALESMGNFENDDDDRPVSITVTVLSVEEAMKRAAEL